TFADLITVETAVRGYVITGDTTYLGPYHAAQATVGGLLAGLRALTGDNPAQQRRLDSLTTLVATRLERFQWTIETRRAGGPAAAARAVIGGRGKELMQLIRASIDSMEDEEGRLLAQRSATLQAKARLARLAAWSGAVIAVTLAGIAGVLVSGELSGRRRAEQIVQETQARFQQMLADDRARVLAEMPVLLAHDRLTTEYRFQYKDGTYHWVHDESRVLRDAAGEPVEVVGSWVDVTDRRRAEEALRASEQRLRLLVGSVRDYAIYLLDATGTVVS